MIFIKKFTTIFIVLLTTIALAQSQENIVYLDLDTIVSTSKPGKSLIDKLEKSKKSALSKFEKKEKELKKIEEEINKQKNIVSEEELKKKLVEFRKEISTFRNDREKVINDFNKKKVQQFQEFFKKITPIIEKYASEKNIDIILDRKNVFVASKKKDITQEIIDIINSKIKWVLN